MTISATCTLPGFEEDARICSWTRSLDESVLAAPFTYTSIIAKSPREFSLWQAVLHFFNHQTHHRGQLTTLLTQLKIDYGATDMIAMPKDYEPPCFGPDNFAVNGQADKTSHE